MELLTIPAANQKTNKGLKVNHATYILHLAPADLSGVMNTCPLASNGCKSACLNTAGRGGMIKQGAATNNIQRARIRKTKLFYEDKIAFFQSLVADISLAKKQCVKKGMKLSIRLNGTSDIVYEKFRIIGTGKTIFQTFPDVQFYDYTKIPGRITPSNYHLTFSKSESNDANVAWAINQGLNIAVVFRGELPRQYLGLPVVSGDDNDLRFLDPAHHVIGLSAKRKAKKDISGFVVA